MFCKNCGNEVENGAKFCNSCGAPQETAPVYENTAQQNVPQYQGSVPYNPNGNIQPPVKAKKSNKGCIVAIIIAVVVFALIIIGTVAIIAFGVANSDDTVVDSSYSDSLDDLLGDSDTTSDTPSAEFSSIFTDNNIVQAPYVFMGLDSRAFASVDSDGIIEKMEFGYDGDKIKELVDTIYYPTTDYTDDLLTALDETFKETFAPADELDCCTVSYETTANYYIITIHSTDLDSAVNLAALSDASVITYDGFATYLSMDETASNLASQGYVER